MQILAHIALLASKIDCFKHPSVLQLEKLQATPFHYCSLIIFILAIIHTLFTFKIQNFAEKLEAQKGKRTIGIHLLLFLSQIEIVFAFWTIPLFIAIMVSYNTVTALEYINTRNYTEALFVVVIVALTASRPIVHIAENVMHRLAEFFGGSLSAWWLTVLTIGPLLGSFITEPGAMTLCALLLSRQFYQYEPSEKLKYATLALLFVNVSVGGVLTNFASPAVLILSHCWGWTTSDLFFTFGWKAALGIILSNFLYWIYFRKEMFFLEKKIARDKTPKEKKDKIPRWIIIIHIIFIIITVSISHYPAVFVASFLFYLGFHQLTHDHQYPIRVRHPMLIGLFLAGLIIHGGLQGWWVTSMLYGQSPLKVMGITIALAGFNDNTAISYLVSLIPSWGEVFEYAVFTGIIAGGGLTVMANAPNPAGYAIVKPHFPFGINPFRLFIAAIIPTLILYGLFFFLGPMA